MLFGDFKCIWPHSGFTGERERDKLLVLMGLLLADLSWAGAAGDRDLDDDLALTGEGDREADPDRFARLRSSWLCSARGDSLVVEATGGGAGKLLRALPSLPPSSLLSLLYPAFLPWRHQVPCPLEP